VKFFSYQAGHFSLPDSDFPFRRSARLPDGVILKRTVSELKSKKNIYLLNAYCFLFNV